MVISRTPLRISFLGGGSDYPDFYRHHGGGAVLSTTIDKYVYLTARWLPQVFDGRRYCVSWRFVDEADKPELLLHPVLRHVLRDFVHTDERGVEIHYHGDLPARAGMGSSSSFVVGAIGALAHLSNPDLKRLDFDSLAGVATMTERDVLKETVGDQDQIAAVYGGLNLIRFADDGTFTVDAVQIAPDRQQALQDHLLLLFTGKTRIASQVASSVVANIPQRAEVLQALRYKAYEGCHLLESNGDLDSFGELLHQAWLLKRQQSNEVSSEYLDWIYERGRDQGAIGGKLLGAGGGGFMLFYAHPDRHEAICRALPQCQPVKFAFEPKGTTVQRVMF